MHPIGGGDEADEGEVLDERRWVRKDGGGEVDEVRVGQVAGRLDAFEPDLK